MKRPRGKIPRLPDGTEFPEYWAVPAMGGMTSYSSWGRTSTQPDIHQTSQFFGLEFRLPRFWETPTVSVQIASVKPAQPHMVFTVNVNDDVNGMTQIAVSTMTADREPCSENDAPYCNILVIGRPRPSVHAPPAKKRTRK